MDNEITISLHSKWDTDAGYRVYSERVAEAPDLGEHYLCIRYQSPEQPDPIRKYAFCWNVIFGIGGTGVNRWLAKFDSKHEAKLFCACMEPNLPVALTTRDWHEQGLYRLHAR